MLLLLNLALAEDQTWTCPTAATVPEDVRPWFEATESVSADVWAIAESYQDGTCVSWSEDATQGSATGCVTTTGAILTYTYDYDAFEDTLSESYTVVPPTSAGVGWTELSATATTDYSASSTTIAAAWVGELDPAWPVDGSFEAGTSTWYGSGCCGYDAGFWRDPTCEWAWEDQEELLYDEVRTAGHEFVVYAGDGPVCRLYQEPYAEVDGMFVGFVDPDTWALTLGTDADGDGWDLDHDCDDTDGTVFPCAEDVPYDGIDQDCDEVANNDADGDFADSNAYGGTDCDDTDPEVYVGAEELACDGVDQDCDGLELCDLDEDGYTDETYGGDDCDDADDAVHPDATDYECDTTDSDCDRVVTCDADGDGHTAEADGWGGDDCNDHSSVVYPGAPEIECDDYDQDCDGVDTCDETDTPEDTPEGCGETDGCAGGLVGIGVLPLVVRRRRRG